jgi:urease accessory protein
MAYQQLVIHPQSEAIWRADLQLTFSRQENRTALTKCLHRGPLTVQKALYPEGPEVCHAVIIHPPGGIAGGDQLSIDIELEERSRAVVTTPAATKWYKAANVPSRQEINIRVRPGSSLDWLPQENLFFNAARAETKFRLEIAPDATAIGWETFMLGRHASNESWKEGSLKFSTEICAPCGRLLWVDRTILKAGEQLLLAPQGLHGFKLFGLLWAVGPACTSMLAEEVAGNLPFGDELRAGVTCLPNGVLLLRVLSQRIEPLRQLLIDSWFRLRPIVNNLAAQPLRLWAT